MNTKTIKTLMSSRMEIGTDTKKARNGPKKIHTYVEEKNERKLSLCYTLT